MTVIFKLHCKHICTEVMLHVSMLAFSCPPAPDFSISMLRGFTIHRPSKQKQISRRKAYFSHAAYQSRLRCVDVRPRFGHRFRKYERKVQVQLIQTKPAVNAQTLGD